MKDYTMSNPDSDTATSEQPAQQVTPSEVDPGANKSLKKVIIKLPAKFGDVNVASPEQLIQLLRTKSDDPQEKEKATTKNKELLKCALCDYTSYNKHYLKQHIDLVHLAERPYKCPFCDYAGKRSHALKEHLVVHSSYRPYECHFCNASFRKKGHLTNHIKLHASLNQSLVCQECKEELTQTSELWKHLRAAHKGKACVCQSCNYATFDANEFKVHMWTHSKDTVHHCTACNFTCVKEMNMLEHIAEAHQGSASCTVQKKATANLEVMLKCSECGFITADKQNFRQHMISHLSEEERATYTDQTYECQCGYKAASETEIKEHTQTEHSSVETNGETVVLKCSECSFFTTNHDAMSSHMHKHLPDGKNSTVLNCAQCQFSSSEAAVFITHMLTHRNRIKAGQEGSSRFHIDSMIADAKSPPHQGYIHDAVKGVYRCTICSYSCEHQRTIKAHTWKHSGHKDIDYPMFQNGPLSIFDYTPIGGKKIGPSEGEGTQKVFASAKTIVDGNSRQIILVPANVSNNKTEGGEKEEVVSMIDGEKEVEKVVKEETPIEEEVIMMSCDVVEEVVHDTVEEGGSVEVCTSQEEEEEEEDDGVSTDSEQQSTSDVCIREQAQALLSLIKHTDKQQPAEDHSYRGQKKDRKAGISASLLAAIEHIRQASQDEGDGESGEKMTKGKRRGRKRRADVLVDQFENVEKLAKDRFRCKICHYTTQNQSLMITHMRVHKSKDPTHCSLCDFISKDAEELQAHMIQHCKVRTYQCKFCNSEFGYKSQLRAHMRAHEDQNPLMCESCDFQTSDLSSYQQHLEMCKSSKNRCSACQLKFCTEEDLKEHECHPKNFFQCTQCDFTTESEESFNKHLRWHGRTYKCEHCEFVCTNYKGMANHMRVHFEEKEQRCKYCDFVAKSIRSLKSHMKRHVNDQRFVQQPLEQYMCNLCGYVCHHLPSLKSHMWRHASDQKYSYVQTNQVINAAIDFDNVTTTTRTSDSENTGATGGGASSPKKAFISFSCCQCGFESTDKAALNDHMKEHEDIIQKTLAVNMGRLAFQTKEPNQL